jgi:aspartate-semialdehyde dehydrogenase
MIAAGFRLVSISPHRRMAYPLIVPVVNGNLDGHVIDFAAARCLKSPNCCSVSGINRPPSLISSVFSSRILTGDQFTIYLE